MMPLHLLIKAAVTVEEGIFTDTFKHTSGTKEVDKLYMDTQDSHVSAVYRHHRYESMYDSSPVQPF